MSAEPFTCPRCGRTSWNANDKKHGYCGACHDFTGGEIAMTLPEGYRPTYGPVILGVPEGRITVDEDGKVTMEDETSVVRLPDEAVDRISGFQPILWDADDEAGGTYSGRFTSETNPVEEVDPDPDIRRQPPA